MASEGKRGLSPHKTTSDTEHRRRQSAVNYARATVGLEGLWLSQADAAHAQHFIDGVISLQSLCSHAADASKRPKSSS